LSANSNIDFPVSEYKLYSKIVGVMNRN